MNPLSTQSSTSDIKKDLNAQCQIVYFDWTKKENLGSSKPNYSALSESTSKDISPYILSYSFSKSMGEAAGSFNLTLKNDRDWKEYIKPGTWALVYLSHEGDLPIPEPHSDSTQLSSPNTSALQQKKDKLRSIIYIETIKASGIMDNGVFDVTYTLSGRDFGVVYEATEIWLNYLHYDETIRNSFLDIIQFAKTQKVHELLAKVHDYFISPQKIPGLLSTNTFVKTGQQWLLPKLLLKILGLSTGFLPSFFGNIEGILAFSPTSADKPTSNSLTYANGTAWEKLKSLSIPELHELYAEMDYNNTPQLVFRPIPWGITPQYYLRLAKNIPFYGTFILENSVDIPAIDILSFSLTENDHNRFNHFFFDIQNQNHDLDNSLTYLKTPTISGKIFPHGQLESIARHGLRRMHVVTDTLITFFEGVHKDLIKEYNELLYDYYNTAVFLEDGTMEIIGTHGIRIGRCIYLPDCEYNKGKAFYIEGYEDNFEVDENGTSSWTQSLVLTRGIELDNLFGKLGKRTLKTRVNPLKNIGDFKKG